MAEAWVELPQLLAPTLVLAGVLGLVMGSFLNCVAWRIVRGESWVSGRSHCDACGHELAPRDLIPVASWLASHGRCRYCGAHVSARNPVTELVCAFVYVLVVAHFGPTAETVEMLAVASVLLVLTLTDLDDYVIPNGCVVALLAIRVAYLAYLGATGADAVGMALGFSRGAIVVVALLYVLVRIMDHVLDRPSMGFGDLKLFGVAGLYFGWAEMLLLLIVSCLVGIASAPVARRLAASGVAGEEPEDVSEGGFPFGPSIAASWVLVALVGDVVLGWYFSLIV